ncbi:MAG: hypothetical protein ABI837_18885, partial [Acidobacteriota bacterium]
MANTVGIGLQDTRKLKDAGDEGIDAFVWHVNNDDADDEGVVHAVDGRVTGAAVRDQPHVRINLSEHTRLEGRIYTDDDNAGHALVGTCANASRCVHRLDRL